MLITLTEHERRRFIAWLESELVFSSVICSVLSQRMAAGEQIPAKAILQERVVVAAAKVMINKLSSLEQMTAAEQTGAAR